MIPFDVLVVLDTNVLVSAIKSRRGASFRVLSRVGTGAFDIAVSVPLVLEYEEALQRHITGTSLTVRDVGELLDYLCRVAKQQAIFYLWRPMMRDPDDDMVAELGFAAGCDAIVTYNRRDFSPAAALGLHVWTPAELLRKVEAKSP